MPHLLALTELQHVLQEKGLRAGMEWLNSRVPHRYTVIYKFDSSAFYGMVVVDKLKEPTPLLFKNVPFTDSFCQYSVGEGVFRTEASLQDGRLDGHIHQANVQSYCGLPLMDPSGNLYGTFCHLDMVPQPLGDDEYSFLEQAVRLLGDHLPATSEFEGA